jgi:murein L,D-transpeptidase YcbB/YkuD
VFRNLQDYRGGKCSGYYCDFTDAAESVGFKRISARSGWQRNYNRREFWHYEYNPNNLTWDEAMAEIKGNSPLPQKPKPTLERIISLNDKSDTVHIEQTRLAKLRFLPKSEFDGVFGVKTKQAIISFQKQYGLDIDGYIGSQIRAKLVELTRNSRL